MRSSRPMFGVPLLLGLAVAVPAGAASAGGDPSMIAIVASHSATTAIALARPETVKPVMLRPGDRYVGLEITPVRASSFAYFALGFADGQSIAGQVTATSVQGTFHRDSGSTITPAPVKLPAGRYEITVFTRKLTVIALETTGNGKPIARHADGPTASDEQAATTGGTPDVAYSYQSVPLTIPRSSHLTLTVDRLAWTGTGTLTYSDRCIDPQPDIGPCTPDPTVALFSADPLAVTPGTQQEMTVGVWLGQDPGPSIVSFYAAVSGTVTSSADYAIAMN